MKSLFTLIDAFSPNEQEMLTSDAPALTDYIPPIGFQVREKEPSRQEEQAAQSLKARQVEVTLSSISRHLHISLPTLRCYPAVMAVVT